MMVQLIHKAQGDLDNLWRAKKSGLSCGLQTQHPINGLCTIIIHGTIYLKGKIK